MVHGMHSSNQRPFGRIPVTVVCVCVLFTVLVHDQVHRFVMTEDPKYTTAFHIDREGSQVLRVVLDILWLLCFW